jgi:hypothetical protein
MLVTFLAAIVLDILLQPVQHHELGSEVALHNDDISRWKIVVREVFWKHGNPVPLCVMIGDVKRILGMDMGAILVAALRFILAPS